MYVIWYSKILVKIRRKTPEQLQAQLAAYTESEIDDIRHRHHIYADLARLATPQRNTITYTENEKYDPTNPTKIPGLIYHHVADRDEYVSYIRSTRATSWEVVRKRQELLDAYRRYSTGVSHLKRSIPRYSPEAHPDFLGVGSYSRVYKMVYGAHELAVRIPRPDAKPDEVDLHVAAMVYAQGIPRLEQVIGVSYSDNVTISEYMPGTPWGKMDGAARGNVKAEHLEQLEETVRLAYHAGIALDLKNPDNLLYDSDAGFGVVDYLKISSDSNQHTSLEDMQAKMIQLLSSRG